MTSLLACITRYRMKLLRKRGTPNRRWPLVILVIVCLGFCLFVMTFRDAVDATPYETTDSAGRTMGFNDRFSSEHFDILLRNCSLGRTLIGVNVYEVVLIVAQLTMIALLLSCRQAKWIARFALMQVLIFPWGVPGMLLLPDFIIDLFTRDVGDREGFVDIPFVPLTAHPMWILVSGSVAWWALRTESKSRSAPVDAGP